MTICVVVCVVVYVVVLIVVWCTHSSMFSMCIIYDDNMYYMYSIQYDNNILKNLKLFVFQQIEPVQCLFLRCYKISNFDITVNVNNKVILVLLITFIICIVAFIILTLVVLSMRMLNTLVCLKIVKVILFFSSIHIDNVV